MKRTSQTDKTALFETMPVPKAVLTLAVPTVASILVTLLYSLADTWFVGLLNDPIQNAAVTLIAPVLLAFNAVNNLFGTGCSSMMSRALGRKDTETAQRCASFGFWCSLLCGCCSPCSPRRSSGRCFRVSARPPKTATPRPPICTGRSASGPRPRS